MPRLEGKQSNPADAIPWLILLVIVVLVVAELVGAMDVIPGFGAHSANGFSLQQLSLQLRSLLGR